MEPNTYAQAGVNIAKAEAFVERLKKQSRREGHKDLWKGAGGYAAIIPIGDDIGMALTTDGVGTKLLIACELNKLETIGIDLVAMCANDLICVGAKPSGFLDYYATSKLDDRMADDLIKGIVEGCDQADMLLVGGETAELPDLYEGKHFDIAGFAVGTVKRDELLTGETIQPGDKLVGVASTGIHSNGLSLARKVLTDRKWKEELLTPTAIYVKPVVRLLAVRGLIKGVANITGGGWRNILRLNANVGYRINNPLSLPEVFVELGKHILQEEMYKTFNMGMGLAVITSGDTNKIIETFKEFNFKAQVVGEATENKGLIEVEGGIVLKGKL